MKKVNLWNIQNDVSEPACLLKWQWTSLYIMQQQASSCHRVEKENISIENFDDFHNTPGVLEARKKMLNGQWPGKGCEYCKNIEEAGGLSDRQQINNKELSFERLTPKEFKEDSTAIHVTPSTLEVFFSNLCNQACLYCFAKYSSKIEAEQRRYNIIDTNPMSESDRNTAKTQLELVKNTKINYPKMKEKFWQWMRHNATNLKNYRILGGEPFFQPEIFENIEFFKHYPCPDLNVNVFSNFNVEPQRVRKILEEFKSLLDKKHIKSFRLLLSIDSWGPVEEYVRSGSNNIIWKQNFDMLGYEFPMFKVKILSTLSNLNIKSSLGLIRIFNNSTISENTHDNYHGFNLVGSNEHLQIGIFPKRFFDDDFDQMTQEIKMDNFKNQLQGYKRFANSKPYRPDLIIILKKYLDQIDLRRNMNWKQTFPWLDKFNPEDYKE